MSGESLTVRFSGSFGEGLEFVEVENSEGESVDVGEWHAEGEYHLLGLSEGDLE